VESSGVESALTAAEASLGAGRGLSGTGFWPAVDRVKRNPELAERYGDRIASIDRAAFRAWRPWIIIPIGLGTSLAVAALIIGIALVGWSYYLDGWAQIVVFGGGLIALLATTHGLGHLVVGAVCGIRFTAWYVAGIKRPQPGVKLDYSSYLRAPARQRAWMHAAGAIATKIVPFALIGAAIAAGLPSWVAWGLAGLGVATVVTDIFWSTNASDWKKFSREMSFDQS
jgi:hypothetical protein